MLQDKNDKQVVVINSEESTPPSAVTDRVVDEWVMLPALPALPRSDGSYFGGSGFGDSDSEEEEEEECLEYLQDDLCTAVTNNNLAQVEKLLQKISPQFQLKDKKTPLSQAIPPPPAEPKKDNNKGVRTKPDPEKIKTNLAIIETLLEANANPNTIIQDGNTVLHNAAKQHNTNAVELLLKHKADINIKNNECKLPYEYVTTYCDPSLAHLLEPKQKSLDRQLLAAVRTKNMDKTQELLKQNANPNIRDQMGRSPLTRAIVNNDPEMVELLIKNRANPNFIINIGSMTASEFAVKKGYNSIALTLQKHIYKQNTQLTPLLPLAVKQGNAECIEAWIKCGINVNMNPKILMIAKKYNNPAVMRLLEQASEAHKIIQTKDQEVINHLLRSALRQGDTQKFAQLIKMVGDVNNIQNKNGDTFLHYAARKNNLPTISVLLKNKADITIKNTKDKTALDIAKVYNKTVIVNRLKKGLNDQLQSAVTQSNLSKVTELIKMGADVNALSPKGNTVLHYAVFIHNPELVSLLLQNKADITIKNNDGKTPSDIAQNIAQQINSYIAQKSNDGQANESVIKQQTQNIEIINLLAPSPDNPNEPVQKFVEKERPYESTQTDVVQKEEKKVTQEANKSQTENLHIEQPHTTGQNTGPMAARIFEDTDDEQRPDEYKGKSEVIHEEEEQNVPQVQEEIDATQDILSANQEVDLWGGGIFKEEDMNSHNLEDETYEEERPYESEDEKDIEPNAEATFTAKKAENKNIIAIKAAAQTEKKLTPHLETLQKAINEKRVLDCEQKVLASSLTQNSNEIKNSIIQLADNTKNPEVLNNLLIIATTQADLGTTKSLLENKLVDKDFGDEKGFTALHYASIQGDVKKVEALIASGAEINIKNKYGNTPLHAAVILNKTGVDKTEVIKLLLEKSADINAQDQFGNTALHFAADAGDHAAVELLQARGADFTIKDKEGLTALDRAIKHTKETIDNIDFTAQEQETVGTEDVEYNLTAVITRQKEDSKQKLPNLIDTVKHFISNAGVKQQDNASFFSDTKFSTLLESLKALGINDQNSVDQNILTSLQSLMEYLNPESIIESPFVDLMTPVSPQD